MSAALVILPVVWATEANDDGYSQGIHEVVDVVEQQQAAPELAFYRKYTEGLLRRYVRLSMEAEYGRSFRGNGAVVAKGAKLPGTMFAQDGRSFPYGAERAGKMG